MTAEGRASTDEIARLVHGMQQAVIEAINRRDDGGIHPLSRVLGGIESSLEAIKQTLAQDRLADAQYRTYVRGKIDAVNDQVQNIDTRLTSVTAAVDDMKPKVDGLEEHRIEKRGANKMGSLIARTIHLIIGAVGGVIVLLADHLWRTMK